MSAQEARKLSVATIDSSNSDHMTIIADGVRFSFRDSAEWESSRRDSLTASLRGGVDTIASVLAQGTTEENKELLTATEQALQTAITDISHCEHKPEDELPDKWTRWYDTPVSSRRPSQVPSAHGTTGSEPEASDAQISASDAQSSEGAQGGEPAVQTGDSGSITVVAEGLEITLRNSEDVSSTELLIRARPGWATGRTTTAMMSAAGTLLSPKSLLTRIIRKPKILSGRSTKERGLGDIRITTEIQVTTEEAAETEWSNPNPFVEPAGDDQNEDTVFDGTQARRPLPTEGVAPNLDDYDPELDMTILSSDGA